MQSDDKRDGAIRVMVLQARGGYQADLIVDAVRRCPDMKLVATTCTVEQIERALAKEKVHVMVIRDMADEVVATCHELLHTRAIQGLVVFAEGVREIRYCTGHYEASFSRLLDAIRESYRGASLARD